MVLARRAHPPAAPYRSRNCRLSARIAMRAFVIAAVAGLCNSIVRHACPYLVWPAAAPQDYSGRTATMSKGLLCAAMLSIFLAAIIAVSDAAEFSGRVSAVIDGDDIELCGDDSACTRIRLCGIDAPERECPGYGEARAALRGPCGRQAGAVHPGRCWNPLRRKIKTNK
jgi:endonuclease YncB( thermonuclease family)